MSKNYGEVIKKLRKEKKLTQHAATNAQISRSALTKIETNSLNPSASNLRVILQQLDVSFEEFFYISDGYQFSEIEKLRRQFLSISSSSKHELIEETIKACDVLLQNGKNISVIEIKNVLLAILDVSENRFEEAKKITRSIRDRLAKVDKWCLSDIKLVSNILYVFPVESAVEIVNKALESLSYYKGFDGVARQEIILKLNLVLVMMSNGEVTKLTRELLDEIVDEALSERFYDLEAIALFRRGHCDETSSSKEDIQRALSIFEATGDIRLRDSLLNEREIYVIKN